MHIYATILLALLGFTLGAVQAQDVENAYCESYNLLTCNDENKEKCVTQQKCGPKGPETHNHCFTLWELNSVTGDSKVHMKGCFLNNKDCYNKSHCVQKNKDAVNQLFFCCCNGDMCNQNVTYTQMLKKHNEDKIATNDVEKKDLARNEQQFIPAILSVCVLIFIVTITFISWYCRHRKQDYESELSQAEQGIKHCSTTSNSESVHSETNSYKSDCLLPELLEKKALGRFGGAVWKARRDDEIIAVKMFPLVNKQSWQTELEVFQLPHMNHENVLKFIDSLRCGQSLDAEFWLITTYQERGSLCDFLETNTVSWNEMHKIALSIVSGLNHLHSEISSDGGYKPAIAHRDLKSTNVLLSGDMRACIADFGLALIFKADDGVCGNQYDRVGTHRYMAPEVLDGAINFTKESFLAIDMYACSLVLWELASRCVVKKGDTERSYRLPFEKEVGSRPTLADMVKCVSEKKIRPHIPETWREHWGLAAMCETMEECWDQDPEARLSASCVLDRISSLKNE
ncbi:activin receptor type-2A-like [Nasonia vitripennis]|uniref:Serine/threonine-protein kinase receptor n=1 Tax=Nasonia vitripennis TaxID=7425 RepID=A0A7M7H4K8_NASVI|nr:activin receptor type-2A-like [Nasonia vitripennis]